MIDREQLIRAFVLNMTAIKLQTDGLTHAGTLVQPPFRGNCMNWVLGHIAQNQDTIASLLGEQPVLDEKARARYATESQPVVASGDELLTLEQLLDALAQSQERIAAGLQRATDAELAGEIQVGQRTQTLAQRVFFLYFHETYHAGQLELLRQLAGKNDKMI